MKQKRESICTILAICFVGVLLGELYLFKTYSNSIYIVAAGMAVLLVLTYFLSSNLIALHNECMEEKSAKQEELLNRLITELSNNKEDRTQATLANVEKFEKAIYLAMQQHTTKMQESFEHLDQCIAGDFDQLHNTLEETGKSIVEQIRNTGDHSDKVYVKFSRENAKSIMMFQKKAFNNIMLGMEETVQEYTKSSEHTLAKLDELKQSFTQLNTQTTSVQETPTMVMEDTTPSDIPTEDFVSEDTLPDISMEGTASDEISINEDVLPDIPSEDNSSDEISMAEDILPDIPTEETSSDEISMAEDALPDIPSEDNSSDNAIIPEEAIIEEPVAMENLDITETPSEEAPTVEEPSPVIDDPNHVMTPEEIAALVAGSSDSPAEEAPIVEEPSPVIDDPNHVMTPEEIAALVAGSSAPATETEAVAEEIPFVDESPVVAEPTPVNSDPNHVMTPEEIAALIAGTQ